jgi:hypothetical protein
MRIVRGKKGIALLALAVATALALAAGALAVFPNDSVTHYTGCLNTNASPGGTFTNVAVGETPSKACGSGQVLVHLSGGDITAVQTASGSGLTGGKDNGAASLALDSTGCSSGGVLKWNGASWSCASDNNTTYSGSDFALSNQNCTSGQFDTGVDTSGHVTCAAPPTPPSTDVYHAGNGGFPTVLSDDQLHEMLSLQVPAGAYAVTASGQSYDGGHDYFVDCFLKGGTDTLSDTAQSAQETEFQSLSLVGATTFSSAGTLHIDCQTSDAGVQVDWSIVAVKVSAVH